jgi:hypothetical protein
VQKANILRFQKVNIFYYSHLRSSLYVLLAQGVSEGNFFKCGLMKYIQHSIYFLIYNSFGVNQQSSSSNEYGKERCLHICTLGMNNPWPVSFLVQPAFAFIHAKRSKQILHSMTMASGLQLCMDL